MATLGKTLKGSSGIKSKAAKTTMLKGKLRAMEEADMARRVAEQGKRIILERLRAEEENSKLHRAKIEAAWMHILRMATVGSLRADVEVLAAQHERDCAHRDASLRMLFDDLMAAEEQYRVALHNHLRQMDRLVELQDARITDLERAFDDELRALTNEFDAEMRELTAQHIAERRELRTLIATITEAEEAKAAEAKHEHETAREEIRNRSIDRIQELSRTLDDRIMELEAAFEQAHVNYLHATDAKTESFKLLVAETGKAEKRIERRAEVVERAKAALVSLRNKMAANAREFEEKNVSLAREKAEQAAHVAALKSKLDAFRAQSDARLQKLSVAVRAARAEMETQVALASRILQAAERARQSEGEHDKIWPVPIPDVAAASQPGVENADGTMQEGSVVVISGPAASSRAAVAMLGGTGDMTGVLTATGGRSGVTLGDTRTLAAAAGSMTAGSIIPLAFTAARHGLVPRADGDAAALQSASAQATALADHVKAVTLAAFGPGAEGAPGDADAAAMEEARAALGDEALLDLAEAARVESTLMRETMESGELDALDLFWRRYNKALVEKLVMERQRERLAAANAELRALVAQCVEGMSVSDATLLRAGGNPLLVVNGRSGVFRPAGAPAGAVNPLLQGAAAPHGASKVHVDATVVMRAYATQGRGR